jgi:hypothetical protein
MKARQDKIKTRHNNMTRLDKTKTRQKERGGLGDRRREPS